MGMTAKAELHYGYHLGDEESGYEIAEVDDDAFGTDLTVPWWDEDGDSFDEQAMAVLRASVGFTETEYSEGFYERQREADARLDVEIERSGYQGGQFLLVVKGRELGAEAGDVVELDPAELTAKVDEAADAALADALRTLGITPKQEKPAWLLTCYYG